MPIRHGDNILRGFRFLQQGRNEHCKRLQGRADPAPTVTCPSCARGTVLFLGLADLSPMIFYSAFLLNNV